MAFTVEQLNKVFSATDPHAEPVSAKRKQLELNLIREIEKAIAGGLDLHFISIELGKVTNVTVSLKDEQSLP